MYVFLIPVLIEMLRVVIKAIVDGLEYAWVIGVGHAGFIVLSLYQMVWPLLGLPFPGLFFGFPYLFGILFLLISMSVYLAQSIGPD